MNLYFPKIVSVSIFYCWKSKKIFIQKSIIDFHQQSFDLKIKVNIRDELQSLLERMPISMIFCGFKVQRKTNILYLKILDSSYWHYRYFPISLFIPDARANRESSEPSAFSSNSGNWFRAFATVCGQFALALYEPVCTVKKSWRDSHTR